MSVQTERMECAETEWQEDTWLKKYSQAGEKQAGVKCSEARGLTGALELLLRSLSLSERQGASIEELEAGQCGGLL